MPHSLHGCFLPFLVFLLFAIMCRPKYEPPLYTLHFSRPSSDHSLSICPPSLLFLPFLFLSNSLFLCLWWGWIEPRDKFYRVTPFGGTELFPQWRFLLVLGLDLDLGSAITAYYRGAMGILLVYDVTDERSFSSKYSLPSLAEWKEREKRLFLRWIGTHPLWILASPSLIPCCAVSW